MPAAPPAIFHEDWCDVAREGGCSCDATLAHPAPTDILRTPSALQVNMLVGALAGGLVARLRAGGYVVVRQVDGIGFGDTVTVIRSGDWEGYRAVVLVAMEHPSQGSMLVILSPGRYAEVVSADDAHQASPSQ